MNLFPFRVLFTIYNIHCVTERKYQKFKLEICFFSFLYHFLSRFRWFSGMCENTYHVLSYLYFTLIIFKRNEMKRKNQDTFIEIGTKCMNIKRFFFALLFEMLFFLNHFFVKFLFLFLFSLIYFLFDMNKLVTVVLFPINSKCNRKWWFLVNLRVLFVRLYKPFYWHQRLAHCISCKFSCK